MRNFVDLHTHSTASDGSLSAGEVVRHADRKRLAAVALTDHDGTAGLPEAARAAAGLGVRFVPGVEISAEFAGGTLHVVGLGIDPSGASLARLLGRMRDARDERNPRMIAKLRQLGIDISMAEVRRFARGRGGGSVIGRLDMAGVLQVKGRVGSVAEAFERYLGPNAPGFVDKERLAPRQAIDAIRRAGGVAILAHPVHLNCPNARRLEQVVRSLARDGLDGIEVYHSDHTDAQTRQYLDLARRRGLLISGGSDFHGGPKPDVLLGRPKVPLAAVEQLLAKITA